MKWIKQNIAPALEEHYLTIGRYTYFFYRTFQGKYRLCLNNVDNIDYHYAIDPITLGEFTSLDELNNQVRNLLSEKIKEMQAAMAPAIDCKHEDIDCKHEDTYIYNGQRICYYCGEDLV